MGTGRVTADTLAGHAADAFAHPVAIAAVIIACLVWGLSKWQNANLTLALSIAALTFSQLILLDAARTDAAVQAKLDRLLIACGAGPALVRAEDRPADEIERMRR